MNPIVIPLLNLYFVLPLLGLYFVLAFFAGRHIDKIRVSLGMGYPALPWVIACFWPLFLAGVQSKVLKGLVKKRGDDA